MHIVMWCFFFAGWWGVRWPWEGVIPHHPFLNFQMGTRPEKSLVRSLFHITSVRFCPMSWALKDVFEAKAFLSFVPPESLGFSLRFNLICPMIQRKGEQLIVFSVK